MRKPISATTRYRVLERDGFACRMCGAKAPNATLQVDHMQPVAKGGSNDEANLQTLCVTCNFGKSDSVTKTPKAGPVILPGGDSDVRVYGEALATPIHAIGAQWAVTSYGVEARDGTYAIEAKRLWEDEKDYGWKKHMSEKEWVDLDDFNRVIDWARDFFERSGQLKRR